MSQDDSLPLAEAWDIVKDLRAARPWIYWVDFLLSMTLGWSAFVLTMTAPTPSLRQVAFFFIAALALYRAAIFTHELAHQRKNRFRGFRLVWNLSCGIPLMIPSFTYRGVHMDHHKRNLYGTAHDGEYLPFGAGRPSEIVAYVLLAGLLPVVLAARFVLLTPLSYLHGTFRHLLWERASSLATDMSYRRPAPGPRDEESWRLQEFATFVFGATVVTLVLVGTLPERTLLIWYLASVLVFVLNSLRTLAAHAFRNPAQHRMSFQAQYLDSVNVPGNALLTPLWAPVGLRYHATHHLFPSLPYHALGEAHRRLVARLKDNRVYLRTERKGLWDALHRLWRDAQQASRQQTGPARQDRTAS